MDVDWVARCCGVLYNLNKTTWVNASIPPNGGRENFEKRLTPYWGTFFFFRKIEDTTCRAFFYLYVRVDGKIREGTWSHIPGTDIPTQVRDTSLCDVIPHTRYKKRIALDLVCHQILELGDDYIIGYVGTYYDAVTCVLIRKPSKLYIQTQ